MFNVQTGSSLMITKVNIKLHRYVGLYMSEVNLFWNIYVNIEYRTTYKHVWTCLSDLKFKKILLISLDFTHKQEKKSCEILWNIYVNIKYIVRRINMSEHVCLTWSSKRSFSSVQIFTHMKQEKKSCWCVLHPGRRLEFQSATHNVSWGQNCY